jgi:hypothetical protein
LCLLVLNHQLEITIMKPRTVVGLLSGVCLAGMVSGLRADLKPNPYEAIIDRNAFALKPVPAEPATPPPPPLPGVEVFLTGMYTIGGTEKVVLQITDKSPGKKTEYPPPLVKGDVQGRVEVVSIDPSKGAVVVKIDQQERTLTFEKDSPKPGAAPPPGGPPKPVVRPPGPTPVPPPLAQPPLVPAASTNAPRAPGKYGVLVGGVSS